MHTHWTLARPLSRLRAGSWQVANHMTRLSELRPFLTAFVLYDSVPEGAGVRLITDVVTI